MSEPSVIQVYVFRDGEYLGSEVFAEPEINIGSGQAVDLFLDDPRVAARHAVLHNAGSQSSLLDLGAPGGTKVNHTPIQHSYVGPRDEIQIGPFTLKLKPVGGKSSLRPTPAQPQAPRIDRPFVQIGIFSVEQNAVNARNQMQAAGLLAEIRRGRVGDNLFWRVVVGPAQSTSERASLITRVRSLGFADAYAVVR